MKNRQIVIEQKELDRLESLAEINESAIKEVLNDIIEEEINKVYVHVKNLETTKNMYNKYWMMDRDKLRIVNNENLNLKSKLKSLNSSYLKYKINILLGMLFGFALATLIFYK